MSPYVLSIYMSHHIKVSHLCWYTDTASNLLSCKGRRTIEMNKEEGQ